jgi:hypothetical protein
MDAKSAITAFVSATTGNYAWNNRRAIEQVEIVQIGQYVEPSQGGYWLVRARVKGTVERGGLLQPKGTYTFDKVSEFRVYRDERNRWRAIQFPAFDFDR